jgi:hypothetical protein
MKKNLILLALLLAVLGIAQALLEHSAAAQGKNAIQAPRFEVDPLWPKPLPNHWILGSTIGVWVDADDHVWIIHRSSATLGNNEKTLETKQGRMLRGRPACPGVRSGRQPAASLGRTGAGLRVAGFQPRHLHRLQRQRVDWRQRRPRLAHPEIHQRGQVPDAGRQERRAPQGRRVGGQSGRAGSRLRRRQQRSGAASAASPRIFVDPKENEAYIADGYLNKRVAVIDADSGKMKRFWGAYGNKPDDTPLPPYNPANPPAQQFYNPVHCADMSVDRFIYVCDRVGDRLQVFTPGRQVRQGAVVREEHAQRRIGVGHRVLEGRAAEVHLHG